MWLDPEIRDYSVSAPVVPGSAERYAWPDHGDPDVALVRSYMQEGGRGMFVLRRGAAKALVEAYYPEDIRPDFFRDWLTPAQKADCQEGRLTAVQELMTFRGHLDERSLFPFKKANRNSRSDLKRKSSALYRLQELNSILEDEDDDLLDHMAEEIGGAFGEDLARKSRMPVHVPADIK